VSVLTTDRPTNHKCCQYCFCCWWWWW